MNLESLLGWFSTFLQSVVSFLFGSFWGIALIILLIIIYFCIKGASAKQEKIEPNKEQIKDED